MSSRSTDCNIAQYFPKYEDQTRRIQALIPQSLVGPADKIRKKRKLTWNELMVGLIQKMVHELEYADGPPSKLQEIENNVNQMSLI